jgi:hypothetical protein
MRDDLALQLETFRSAQNVATDNIFTSEKTLYSEHSIRHHDRPFAHALTNRACDSSPRIPSTSIEAQEKLAHALVSGTLRCSGSRPPGCPHVLPPTYDKVRSPQ